ncbi:hypothetical protein TNCV_1694461 [Trichonephila clavipes]|nr:hypothetical protein TNCV_1694461 [Trichonephila clavipes]
MLSRERDEAPTVAEAPGPTVPCLQLCTRLRSCEIFIGKRRFECAVAVLFVEGGFKNKIGTGFRSKQSSKDPPGFQTDALSSYDNSIWADLFGHIPIHKSGTVEFVSTVLLMVSSALFPPDQ